MTTSVFGSTTTTRVSVVPTTLSIAVHIAVATALVTLGPLLATTKQPVPDLSKAVPLVVPRDVIQHPRQTAPRKQTTDALPAPERPESPPPAVLIGALDPATSTRTTLSTDAAILLGGLNTLPATTSTDPAGIVGVTGMFSPAARQQTSGTTRPPADTRARLLSTPSPSYTEEAKHRGITGSVILEVTLQASGAVRVLRVLSPLGYGLDEAAIEAVNHTRCIPASKAGQPVAVTATITVVFTLT